MKQVSEKWVVGLIGAIQFVNILDFMMVMPMGPDFAKALDISNSHLGWIGGSYTLAATVAGLLGSTFLDRFDRRKALFIALLGLAGGTIMGGIANGLPSLMIARVIAGSFGGPATSISLSIISDTVPPERRGRAMGAVMGAFSVASVLGVPIGLELARIGGWRVPFFAVGSLILLITFACIAMLPPMTKHFEEFLKRPRKLFDIALFRGPVIKAYSIIALGMASAFMMVPNFSAYFQYNLGFPRENLGFLYMAGGLFSFFTLRLAGKMVDRFSSTAVAIAGTALLSVIIGFGYIMYPPLLPLPVIFVGFMISMSTRNVAVTSLTTKVPESHERARFMSFQSAVQHAFSSFGAFFSAIFLGENSQGHLIGMDKISAITLATSLIIPLVIRSLERDIRGP